MTEIIEKVWVKTGEGRYRLRYIKSGETVNETRPAPNVISDTLGDAVQSPADGKFYTSKSALRATYRPSGNPQGESYLEVGNEAFNPKTPQYEPDRRAIAEAIGMAMQQFKNR